LIDFGLSKHLASARTLGVGTPDYLSPEMLQVWTNYTGTPVPYDARAVDAWAMGVLMFLLITGKYPFEW
ncbi:protein kinase domain-containing protein, partial [Haematococcus lacustris]